MTVIAAGSSLNVPQGNAKLFAWYPGQAGGTALARILFGEVSPSGHLPLTFYQDVKDLPPFEDYSMKNRTYRYFNGTPLYPFGFGMSYTRFSLAGAEAKQGEVQVCVTNKGDREGDAVVQVYVACDSPDAPLHPRLCGFRRVSLKPGETKQVAVSLDPRTKTVVDEAGNRIPVERATLYVGLNQPDDRSVELTGQKPLELQY